MQAFQGGLQNREKKLGKKEYNKHKWLDTNNLKTSIYFEDKYNDIACFNLL